jgi:hypothetical protein
MSKVVKVSGGDYTVAVQGGGKITLDTGYRTGQVIITGSLDVQGSVTYIESQNTSINDNIIVLNKNESNQYVSLQYSGIEISRGNNLTYGNAQILYNENTSIDGDGTVILKYSIGGTYIPLETNKVISNGDLILFPGTDTGVVSVAGTNNYETRVVSNTTLTNKKYVDDAIALYFATHFAGRIQDLNTRVTVIDFASSGQPSEIGFVLDNAQKAKINPNGFTIDNTININGNIITNLSGSTNLKLVPNNGKIELQGYVVVDNKTSDPSAVAGAGIIYTKSSEGPGRTGIYFVNNTPNADELVSRNRALLWSILF